MAFEELDLNDFEDEFIKSAILKKRKSVNFSSKDILQWRPKESLVEALIGQGYERSDIEIEARSWALQFVTAEKFAVNLSATFKKYFLAKKSYFFSIEDFCKQHKKNNSSDNTAEMALLELSIEWQGRGSKTLDAWERLLASKL